MPHANDTEILMPLDISGLASGNIGIDYVHRFDSGVAGPDVLVTALVHGNELCGVHAFATFFDLGIRPEKGRLTLCFCNVEAYETFDPAAPARARYVDEDFNRVWDQETLDGARRSVELRRARAIRPLLDQADVLLDIHSMQTACEPLMLAGQTARSRLLAQQMGYPRIVVADPGHASGRRMRDYGDFSNLRGKATALLAECGQHQEPPAADYAREVLARFLLTTGLIRRNDAERLSPLPDRAPPRTIEVTDRITVRNGHFSFVTRPESLDVVPLAGTLIGHDGDEPVITPYDDCVMIMPSRRLSTGQTALRLGRYLD